MNKHYTFKIVIGGAGGVGKTTLLHRYCHDIFKSDTKLTIGVNLQMKELVRDGQRITLSLWDLGGQDRFRFLQPSQCRGARAGIVFFDMNRFGSMEQVKDWVTMFRLHAHDDIPIILGGTKCDLIDQPTLISVTSLANETVKSLGLSRFVPTSAKSGDNVENVITIVVDAILSKNAPNK